MQDNFETEAIDSSNTSESDDSSPKMLRSRRTSTSFLAVRDALYQLTCLNDFTSQKIGGGFFADVFKVTHKTTGEVMVLKMNKSRKTSKQMLAEIQLMNRLSHPNILGFKGSCVHEGQLHALTEYINGGTVEDLLHNKHIPLSWTVRTKIAKDIANGMAYLHSKGVFHRDLSSKNCLIQKKQDGTLKTVVADFGLAAKIKHKRRSYTETVGSPYWMAPECLRGREYCEQADVFSYGIILAEILSRLPADPDFLPRTQQFGVDIPRLKPLCEGSPPELWDLLLRCSQLDPDDRPTFKEIVDIFDRMETMDNDICTCTSPIKNLSTSVSEPALSKSITNGYFDHTDGMFQCPTLFPPSSPSSPLSPVDNDMKLSTLLEGSCSTETDGIHPKRKDFIIHNTSPNFYKHHGMGGGEGDSGIDPGMWLKSTPDFSDQNTLSNIMTTPTNTSTNNYHNRQTSDSSDLSFQLPSPSFAWAPPSSPVRHNRASFSFPSSPTSHKPSISSFDGSSSSLEFSPTCRTQKLENFFFSACKYEPRTRLPFHDDTSTIINERGVVNSANCGNCHKGLPPVIINHSSTPNLHCL